MLFRSGQRPTSCHKEVEEVGFLVLILLQRELSQSNTRRNLKLFNIFKSLFTSFRVYRRNFLPSFAGIRFPYRQVINLPWIVFCLHICSYVHFMAPSDLMNQRLKFDLFVLIRQD